MERKTGKRQPMTSGKKVAIAVAVFLVAALCISLYFFMDIKNFKGNGNKVPKSSVSSNYEKKDKEEETSSSLTDDYSDSRVANPNKTEKGEGLEKHNIDRSNTGFKEVPNSNEKSEGQIVELAEDFIKDPEGAKAKYKGKTVRIESSSYRISGNRNFILLTPNTGNPEIDRVQFTCYVSPSDRDAVDRMEKAVPVYVEGRIGYVGKVTGFDIDATSFGYVK